MTSDEVQIHLDPEVSNLNAGSITENRKFVLWIPVLLLIDMHSTRSMISVSYQWLVSHLNRIFLSNAKIKKPLGTSVNKLSTELRSYFKEMIRPPSRNKKAPQKKWRRTFSAWWSFSFAECRKTYVWRCVTRRLYFIAKTQNPPPQKKT